MNSIESSLFETLKRTTFAQNHLLAAQFFLCFARFEYSLKRAGFVRGSMDYAEARWDRFALKHRALIEQTKAIEFTKAVGLFRDSPPAKQIFRNKKLCWKEDDRFQPMDSTRLLLLVRRVRNNLFHGGKFPGVLVKECGRDQALIHASMIVLETFLEADEAVKRWFFEDLEDEHSGAEQVTSA